MELTDKLVLALPKGRILEEVMPLVKAAGIHPEAAFDDPKSRALQFDTNIPNLSIIRVRAFDAATFVAFGAAHLAVVHSRGSHATRESCRYPSGSRV